MKNIVLLLCLAFIAFSEPACAQNLLEKPDSRDTLIIKLQNRNQLFMIGNSLRDLTGYLRADSLKSYFFQDLEKTLAANNFQELPKRVHYLVNQHGKRRLKAEIPSETEATFNLEYEKKRLLLDLPPLHYTIYDLSQHVELHYFLEDSSAFELAKNTPLEKAILKFKEDRKNLTGLTSYRLEQNSFGFEKRNPKKKTNMSLEAFGYLGGMFMGSQPSPVISYDVFLALHTKPTSAINYFRLGFSYNAFVLSDFKDGQFSNLNPGSYWHGVLQSNYILDKDSWFGFSFGQIKTSKPNGLPKNAFKWGLVANYKRDSFSFDAIELGDNIWKNDRRRQLYMVTYRRSIL